MGTLSEDKSQLAVKTPLGWVIMGKPAQTTRPLQTENKSHAQNSNNVAFRQQTTTTPSATPKLQPESNHAQVSVRKAKPRKQKTNSKKRKTRKPKDTQTTSKLSDAQASYLANKLNKEDDQTAQAIQSNRDDELPGYNNDEVAFLKDVLKGTRLRPDNMIELPLPFMEENPKFPFNRNTAKNAPKI